MTEEIFTCTTETPWTKGVKTERIVHPAIELNKDGSAHCSICGFDWPKGTVHAQPLSTPLEDPSHPIFLTGMTLIRHVMALSGSQERMYVMSCLLGMVVRMSCRGLSEKELELMAVAQASAGMRSTKEAAEMAERGN